MVERQLRGDGGREEGRRGAGGGGDVEVGGWRERGDHTVATQFRRLHPYLVRRGWETGSRG